MKPFTVLKSRAIPLDRANVDTDAIIPKQFLKAIHRTGFGKNLFFDWRYLEGNPERPNPEFVLNQPAYRGGAILLAGENFGCGSSREHAAWALDDYGIRCVVAPSYSDIFYNNALKNGLLPAVAEAAAVRRLLDETQAAPGLELTVDLTQRAITAPSGFTAPFTIADEPRRRLLEGLDDIALTLSHGQAIDAYEKARAAHRSWQ